MSSDAAAARRILLILAAALTVAIGSVRRQKAPVAIGGVVTAVATLHEMILLGRFLPWWVLVVLFTATGVLLLGLGATYEKRRSRDRVRLRVKYADMR